MSRTLSLLFLFVVFLAVGDRGRVSAQVVDGVTLVEARLVADTAAVTPGKPFTAGLHLKMAPRWHTYWINPGDSGIPITLDWELPQGWTAGPIQWPVPGRYVEPGDMVVYGYKEEVVLLVELTPPAELPQGEVLLKAKSTWLVCDQSCVPGEADLELRFPAQGEAQSALIERFRSQLPKTGPPPFEVRWEATPSGAVLRVEGAKGKVEFFPISPIQSALEPIGPGEIRVPYVPGSNRLEGLVVVSDEASGERQAWHVENAPAEGAGAEEEGTALGVPPGLTLSTALLFGFIGGFILNLMPCVLPVIALKIVGFMGQAGESRQRVFRMGLTFVAGIFFWFLAIATLVVIARSMGRDVNWAFQFQNPTFVWTMMVIIFVFSLNLLGVFEIWLPGTNRLVSLSGKSGYGGTFLHGMFATLMATPCTAPFLGPVLPFAFTQSALVTFAMFTSIAAGMGFPYLILAAKPGWMRFLPRPGVWMERLKQFMGFLLLGTVVWLVDVIGGQQGLSGATGAGWLLLGIGLAAWIFGNWIKPGVRPPAKLAALVSIVAVLYVAYSFSRPQAEWEPWSPERVAALRAEKKLVFVDFTADWCVTCKVNKRFVLNTKEIKEALGDFVTLQADWTKGDPAITAELKRHGRAGIPVYLVYPANGGEPEILPELLTNGIVLEALERAREKR